MWFIAPGEYSIRIRRYIAGDLAMLEKVLADLLRDPRVVGFQVLHFGKRRIKPILGEESEELQYEYEIIVLYVMREGRTWL